MNAVHRLAFGAAVQARRQARGWRQEDLAMLVGTSRGIVQRIEYGERWPAADEARALVGLLA